MKENIIRQLKKELALIEAANNSQDLERHIYAMESLLNVLKGDEAGSFIEEEKSAQLSNKDREMLELMGGKTIRQEHTASPNRKREVTDDGAGNGDSIFDF
jgi:hypothetical protein